ncbi:MAG: hypothetical protein RIS69_1334, partial [Actinomycetota bacterium]
ADTFRLSGDDLLKVQDRWRVLNANRSRDHLPLIEN